MVPSFGSTYFQVLPPFMLYAANCAGPGGVNWWRFRLLDAMKRFDGFAGLMAMVVSCWLNGSRLVLTLRPTSRLTTGGSHSSRPCTPSSAVKKRWPPETVSDAGFEWVLPGLMSLTRTVPAAVPSLFHSSWPLVPLEAEKNNVPLTFVSSWTFELEPYELPPPGRMSLTRTVPAAVPLLFHSSSPLVSS